MRCIRQLFFASLWCATSWALHESDVGVVDWHKELIGVPLHESIHTAPVFHEDLILTATKSNVLAALNTSDGTVVWRSIYDAADPILLFKIHGNSVTSLSGPGGATLREYDIPSGHLLLEKRLHNPLNGRLHEPSNLGTAVVHVEQGSEEPARILALTNGDTVHSVDSVTGDIAWTWNSPDQGSLIMYSQILADKSTVYVIGLAKSTASYTLHVTTLSTTTGETLASVNIPANIADGLTDFLGISASSNSTIAPCIVWLEKSAIKAALLTPDLKGQIMAIPTILYKSIIDVGLSTNGQLMALKEDNTAQVLHLDAQTASLRPIWEFAGSAPSTAQSQSVFVGSLDLHGEPRIARVYWSHAHNATVHQTFVAQLAEGKGSTSGFTFPFETQSHGAFAHVAFDGTSVERGNASTRMLLTTTTGAIQLWQHDKVQWVREEALATIQVAEFVELPEKKVVGSHVGLEEETFLERIIRQFADAKNLPQYLLSFAKRFATGSYATVSASAAASAEDTLSRDAFGFRQVIVAATAHGKLFGIDSSSGQIMWSRVLGLGWARKVGGTIIPVKMYVTRTVSDGDGDTPQVMLIVQRRADNTLVDTVLFHVDALTGEDARDGVAAASPPGSNLEGVDVIQGPLIDVFMLPTPNKTLAFLDEFLQVRLYPDTAESLAEFETLAPSLHLALRAGSSGQRQILGHQVTLSPDLSQFYVAYPTWSVSFPAGEEIKALIPNTRTEIASIGKVLGNRSTLYKYLNPHLTAVLTTSLATSPPTCAVYLVDGVKGTIVYHASVPAAEGTCDVHASLTENWLVYQYFDDEFAGIGQSKGYHVVSVELYEGQAPDEKTRSSDTTSYSNKTLDMTVYEQTYVMPHGITAIMPTATKFGVTMKDIIVASRKNSVQSIPRRLLNPRRPKQKPTAEEQEEMLIQYDAVLPDDPRFILSHNYKVANVRTIVTSPSLLESTSLVFAYGLDLFFTRVAPSNTFDVLSENFNKAQLVLTVAGLVIAIMVTKPMVARKRLKERWYQ
ncbi:hypothetical protein BJ138DRAFT_1015952 [Hygrophoropsis aurantiaca]|uniref:Uncharacterized protein n=1 Tax=Hygrophoropsis aurantiaca TaxID=72124 RepID=A0ACB7ZZU1_9AGAM|nr:hypothetical protein BJ138DRAFT_1015952 [Hygrophoropsis aurantiaca]